MEFSVSSELNEDTKIYRYINIKQFLSLIENKKTYLTRVVNWEDTWEAPLRNIPVNVDGDDDFLGTYYAHEYVYGQCWSLNGESDALWRIYSPNKDGIMIQTTIKKLASMSEIEWGLIAPVIYYEDLQQGLDVFWDLNYDLELAGALLKRKAFNHEEEIRLVALFPYIQNDESYIELDLDPNELIESIVLDPRCEGWYFETIKKYSLRSNLCTPQKSTLYQDNINEVSKMKMIWKQVPDDDEEKEFG